ncbi:MAG: SIS domain-containing protein [Bacteroidales bacterium]|nr:SIS domain-containing protein [Bacteroidales bacterium]
MKAILDTLIERYPALATCRDSIWSAAQALVDSYAAGGKLLIAGNGGSAADAEHIVGEMMKSFVLRKKLPEGYGDALVAADPDMGAFLRDNLHGALPAIALDGHVALTTACMNDFDPQLGFAQQVNGYGCPGDVFLAISTSGNSRNVLYAAVAARARGLKVIGLTGERPSKLDALCDICIKVPAVETFKVQEFHLPVYHCLCLMVEHHFYKD